MDLVYPLTLFENLQDLPPFAVLENLAENFQARFVPSVPFLSRVTCLSTEQINAPFYLLVSKALLGAAASTDPEHRALTTTLWSACTSLVTGTVEVDNSLGRVLSWLSAVRHFWNYRDLDTYTASILFSFGELANLSI